MYRSLVLLLLLFATLNTYAQSSVRGTVTDADTMPVPGCKVSLLQTADSIPVMEVLTDSSGAFSFAGIFKGDYMIRAVRTGFENYVTKPLHVDSLSQVDAVSIMMQHTGKQLGEVTVTSYKPSIEFKNGTVVMNVENNPLASGMTVLELLKLVPGVMFDAQGNVTINGKSSVSFMMNGRLQQVPAKQMLSILGGMSAETIASVELIKNPSAKYDASGTAGIINIVAKKVKVKGFSGNVSENVSYGQQAASVTSGMLNFKSNRLTVFTNVSYWYRDIVNKITTDRVVSDGTTTGQINSRLDLTNYKRVLTARGGMEYELSTKWTVGAGVNTAPSQNDMGMVTKTNVGQGIALGYDRIYNNAYNGESYNNPSGNIYALYTDTNGTQLKFNADYTNFHDAFSGLTRSDFYDNNNDEVSPRVGYKNKLGLDFDIFTQKLDLEKKLSKTLSMEAGVKSSFVNNNSDFSLARNAPGTDVYYDDSTASNKYHYKERILAAYVNMVREKGKFAMQAGLRAEQTNINAVNSTSGYKLHQDYLNLFPSASLNYKVNDQHSLQLTYSYRIDRPGYDQLNPMRVFNDPLNYSTGNAQLRPEYSHNVGAEYNYRGFLTNSFSYTRHMNSLYSYSYLDSQLIQVDTTVNYASSDQFTYGLFLQMPVTKWYNMQASGTAIYGTRYGLISGVNTSISTFIFMAGVNNDIVLSKTCKLQVNARYSSPFKDGIQNYSARSSIDVAVQQKFLKTKLTATLQINDLLYSNILRYNSNLPDQSIYFTHRTDSRRLRLVVSYRFGNMRVDRKMRNENEEAKRIKKTN